MWTGIETVESCGRCDTEITKVTLTAGFIGKCRGFVEEYKDSEWAGVIIGQTPSTKNPVFVCETFIVPEQEVGETRADPKEDLEGIGIIHSHNKMGAFFSPDDLKTASNYPISLVVNNDLQFKAKVRQQLTCGAYLVGEAKIQYQVPIIEPTAEEKAKIKEGIKEKIKDKIKDQRIELTQPSLFEPTAIFPHQGELEFDEFATLMKLKPEEATVRFTNDDTLGQLHSRTALWENCKKQCGKRARKECWQENIFWLNEEFVLICPRVYNAHLNASDLSESEKEVRK